MPAPLASFHIPSPALGACMMAGVERDTRGCALDDHDRLNFYPATPLVTISWVFHGQLHLVDPSGSAATSARLGAPLPKLVFSGPQRRPTASWSPGEVHALMVSFYPEAMARLLGQSVGQWVDQTVPLADIAPPALLEACHSILLKEENPFAEVERQLQPHWTHAPQPSLAPFLGDWVRSLATRATHSTSGRSLRQWQRRVRDWTGQSQRDLQRFVRIEDAFIKHLGARSGSAAGLAEIAVDAGFSDQSHMGREVKHVTGTPAGRFGERFTHDESFWFYRLVAAEFGRPV